MSVRAVEFYSGIGGLRQALMRSRVMGLVVRAFDWDQTACQVYNANYGTDTVVQVDISSLSVDDLAVLKSDLWLLSPSCQPYTVLNANPKGASDPRARSFLHLMEDILPQLAASSCHPQYILIENVAGFEDSDARQSLLLILKTLGYVFNEFLLTPLQFGIPNSRLRYYLLAKLSVEVFASERILKHIPGQGQDWVDDRRSDRKDAGFPTSSLRPYLDDSTDDHTDFLRIPERVLHKWGRLFDIVLPSSKRTCCFTRGYTRLVERSGSILQMNEDANTTATFDNFFRAQSHGDEKASCILQPLKLRYFSPRELLRLFHFEPPLGWDGKEMIWPSNVSDKSKYRLIGNSINVDVVTRLVNFLFEDWTILGLDRCADIRND